MKVEIAIPVYNEQQALQQSIPRLSAFLTEHCWFDYEVIIGDNASTDRTFEIAKSLSRQYPFVRVEHLTKKGRGGMLKHLWSQSSADILTYMDVDLSTDLYALPPMVEALRSGGFDLGIGSRLLCPHSTRRGLKRECISRCYNLLVKLVFRTKFSDAQCGFKGIRNDVAKIILPQVHDRGWFFDTELLIVSEKLGFRIYDQPVAWTDDPDSRVKIVRTAIEDIKGLVRLKRGFAHGCYKRPAELSYLKSSPLSRKKSRSVLDEPVLTR